MHMLLLVSLAAIVVAMVIPDEREALDMAIEGVLESFCLRPSAIFSEVLSLLCILDTLSAPSG